MADLKRWFKVWTSLLVDMDNLPDDLIGKWVKLGCRIALVGAHGTVRFDDWAHVASFFCVTVEEAKSVLFRLPGVRVEGGSEGGENRHGAHAVTADAVRVTMQNWTKYQEDSTQAERQKVSRAKRRGEEKRREETREEDSEPSLLGGGEAGGGEEDDVVEGASWGTPDALVALYSASIPPGHPKCLTLSDERRRKCRKYLRQFPAKSFWEKVFEELRASEFLLHGTADRPIARDLDWLLQSGKDGVENCVKTYEGKYRARRPGVGSNGATSFEHMSKEERMRYLKTGEVKR